MASLGRLSLLPLEIRCSIWQYLGFDHVTQKLHFAILLVSRAIYDEASREIYNLIGLFIQLYGPNSRLGSWQLVTRRAKQLGTPFGPQWTLSHYQYACKKGFHKIPYRKLGSLTVALRGPLDDFALCLLFQKIVDLVDLFNEAGGANHLKINFAMGSWQAGEPRSSERSSKLDASSCLEPSIPLPKSISHWSTLLRPLTCTNTIDKLSIGLYGGQSSRTIHDSLKGEDWYEIFQMTPIAENELSSTSDLASLCSESRAQIQRHVDTCFLESHNKVDTATLIADGLWRFSGFSPGNARERRFRYWYDNCVSGPSRYENQMAAIYKRQSQGYQDIPAQMANRFFWLRVISLQALNQWSVHHRIKIKEREKTSMAIFVNSNLRWNQKEWQTDGFGGRVGPLPSLEDHREFFSEMLSEYSFESDAERLQALIRGD
ncbi:MAG: hypothetical protein Q9227_009305 [Pyrenula ochraceoflavens]